MFLAAKAPPLGAQPASELRLLRKGSVWNWKGYQYVCKSRKEEVQSHVGGFALFVCYDSAGLVGGGVLRPEIVFGIGTAWSAVVLKMSTFGDRS